MGPYFQQGWLFLQLLVVLCVVQRSSPLVVQQCTDLNTGCWRPMGYNYTNPTPEVICTVLNRVSNCQKGITGCASQAWAHLVYSIGKSSLERISANHGCDLNSISPVPEEVCGQERYICLSAYADTMLYLQTSGRGNSVAHICQAMQTYSTCWLESFSCTLGGRPELQLIIDEENARTKAFCQIPQLEMCKAAEEQCGSIVISAEDDNVEYCKNLNLKLSCYAVTECITDVQIEILKTNGKNQSIKDGKRCTIQYPLDPNTPMSSVCRVASRPCVEKFVQDLFDHNTDSAALCVDLSAFLTCYQNTIGCSWTTRDLQLISLREQRRMRVVCDIAFNRALPTVSVSTFLVFIVGIGSFATVLA